MHSEKYLIVNADDFGQSPGINRGIVEAHERGIVTSASLMTRWLAAGEAAFYATKYPRLSVGLHLDLGEWFCRAGSWKPLYTVVPLDDASAVEREIYCQLEMFRYLVGRDPSHINSHQNVHMREPVRSIGLQLCEKLGVPLRNLCPQVHYFMKFYGQTADGLPLPSHIGLAGLIDTLASLPNGLSVLSCHPGYANDLKTMYQLERAQELSVLCDPRLKDSVAGLGIKLCSFEDCKDLGIYPGRPGGVPNRLIRNYSLIVPRPTTPMSGRKRKRGSRRRFDD